MRAKRLAKIIELAEILHEPVEHECLRPLMAPTQKEELKGDKSLATPQSHDPCYLNVAAVSGSVRSLVTIPLAAVPFNPYGPLVYVVHDEKDDQGADRHVVTQQFVTTGMRAGIRSAC